MKSFTYLYKIFCHTVKLKSNLFRFTFQVLLHTDWRRKAEEHRCWRQEVCERSWAKPWALSENLAGSFHDHTCRSTYGRSLHPPNDFQIAQSHNLYFWSVQGWSDKVWWQALGHARWGHYPPSRTLSELSWLIYLLNYLYIIFVCIYCVYYFYFEYLTFVDFCTNSVHFHIYFCC